MKIALIYPPFGPVENQPNIEVVSDNYGVFPPLNLAYVAAILEELGHEVALIDANALQLSKKDVLKRVKKFNPDLLGFTITTYLFHETLEWIRYLKYETDLPVMVGGTHLNLYPKETLKYKEIDYGIRGEAEQVMPEFMSTLERGGKLDNVDGIIYKKKGKIVINNPVPYNYDLDSVPFPARHLLPNEKYYSFISKKKNFTAMITSRGCPFRCIFCEQGGKPFRFRSGKNVVDEMEECYYNFNIKEIDIFDSTFTLNKKRVVDICQEIRKRKLEIDWSIRSRVDTIDEKILEELGRSGCIRIYYGIESGDENILRTIGKEIKLTYIKKIIRKTKEMGINTFGYFMFGCPGETEETIKRTINFAIELDLDYAQFNKLSTLPGTNLYKILKKKIKEDYWRIFLKDESKRKILPRVGCNLSEEEIEIWVKNAYKKFYFRPKYILKVLKNVRSFNEIWRYTKAAIEMLFR